MRNAAQVLTKALAYFHRYGWIAAMLLCLELTSSLWAISAFLMGFAVWTVLGYHLRWKHIGCSFQNAYYKKMAPDRINWERIRKADVYVVSAIFFAFGLGLILVLHLD